MLLKGIETVVYFVDDMKAASAWWRKVLGIEPNYDTPYYTGFTVSGDELGLHPNEEPRRATGADRQNAYWSVDDVKQAVAHFIEHGAKEHKPIQDVGGGILIGFVEDPFGNIVGLIQNPKSPNRSK